MENDVKYVRESGSVFPVWFYNGRFYATADRDTLRMIDAGIFNFKTEQPSSDVWVMGSMYHEALRDMASRYLEQDDNTFGLAQWNDTRKALSMIYAKYQNEW